MINLKEVVEGMEKEYSNINYLVAALIDEEFYNPFEVSEFQRNFEEEKSFSVYKDGIEYLVSVEFEDPEEEVTLIDIEEL